jgi:hypothetical protein
VENFAHRTRPSAEGQFLLRAIKFAKLKSSYELRGKPFDPLAFASRPLQPQTVTLNTDARLLVFLSVALWSEFIGARFLAQLMDADSLLWAGLVAALLLRGAWFGPARTKRGINAQDARTATVGLFVCGSRQQHSR